MSEGLLLTGDNSWFLSLFPNSVKYWWFGMAADPTYSSKVSVCEVTTINPVDCSISDFLELVIKDESE